MTADDVGCASAAVDPRPARTRTSNTSNRFVATRFTREGMSAERLSFSSLISASGKRTTTRYRDVSALKQTVPPSGT